MKSKEKLFVELPVQNEDFNTPALGLARNLTRGENLPDEQKVLKGMICNGVVIVSGNLCMHDGCVCESILIVQGDFLGGGYIKNSVVIAGERFG